MGCPNALARLSIRTSCRPEVQEVCPRRPGLLRAGVAEGLVGSRELSIPHQPHGLDDHARDVAGLFLDGVVPVEGFVAGRVRLVVALSLIHISEPTRLLSIS